MTAAKNAKVGDLLRVPAHLLFPQRSGKWNRHDFSTAQVIRVGKGRSGGAMVMVRFYDEFRYTPGDPVRIECFYLDNCAKTDLDWQEHGWTRCPDITQEHIDREIAKGTMAYVDGKLYSRARADALALFATPIPENPKTTGCPQY